MNWLIDLLTQHTAIQSVIIISFVIACGLGLGKIRVWGVSLGSTWVFFMGILMGHLGFTIDGQMLHYAESFGLVLFVYALGLQVGPGFVGSFRMGGIKLNMLSMGVLVLGTAMAIGLHYVTGVSLPDMMGILCGAVTNTPALGAAQQTLEQMGIPANTLALGCAVAYPLGVIGVIIAIIVIQKLWVTPDNLIHSEPDDPNQTYIAAFQVRNPGIFNKSIYEIAQLSTAQFVISRIWSHGSVIIPNPDVRLKENQRLLVITTEKDVMRLTALFGEQENRDWNKEDIDWDHIDNSHLISKHVVVSKSSINGRKLGSLKLRSHYNITVSTVLRSGMKLLATPGLRLQYGDSLTAVGEAQDIENVEKLLGDSVQILNEPNMAAIFIGIVLGLLVGSVPILIPGISTPVKLGLAGGPVIMGILIGAYGPRFHMITYATPSANLMLRGVGLSMYLACLGLESGPKFFETVMRPEGALWVALGFAIAFIPMIVMAWVSMKWCKLDFGATCGMLCGSMANPMALNYANTLVPNDSPAVCYATVYPLGMFMRVIVAQLVLMVLLS